MQRVVLVGRSLMRCTRRRLAASLCPSLPPSSLGVAPAATLLRRTPPLQPMAPAWFRFFEIPNLVATKSLEIIVNPDHCVDRSYPTTSNVALEVFETYSDTLVPGSEKAALLHDTSLKEAVIKVTWATDEVFLVPTIDDVRTVVHIINERMLYVLEDAKKKGVLIPTEKILPDDDDFVVMRARSPYHPAHRRWDPEQYD